MASAQQASSRHPIERTPERDHGGGAALAGESSSAVCIRDSALRALDVVACEQLEMLDLSAVTPGLVITVRDCPRLRRILVPNGPPGAVVHWCSESTEVVAVHVEGAVAELDARLGAADIGLPRRQGSQPWSGALLTNAETLPDPLAVDAVCWVGARSGGLVQLTAAQEPAALILSAGYWSGLQAEHVERLEQVWIREGVDLREIALPEALHRLEVRTAPKLERIAAGGRALSLDHCGAGQAPVTVLGHWRSVYLAHTRIDEQAAARVGHLIGDGGAVVPSLIAHYRDRPLRARRGEALPLASVAALLGQAEAGDAEAADLFLRWAEDLDRRHVAYTIRALLRLAEAPSCPMDTDRLWAARCRLRRRLASQLRETPGLWRWDLPQDQRLEAQQADQRFAELAFERDVAVTEALAAEVVTPALLMEVMKGTERSSMTKRALAETLFRRALEHPAWLGTARRSVPLDHQQVLDAVNHALQKVLHRGSISLADAFAQCVGGHLRGHEALPLLEPLAERGHSQSRAQAMAIALRGADGHPSRRRAEEQADLRRQAMRVALSPARLNDLSSGVTG